MVGDVKLFTLIPFSKTDLTNSELVDTAKLIENCKNAYHKIEISHQIFIFKFLSKVSVLCVDAYLCRMKMFSDVIRLLLMKYALAKEQNINKRMFTLCKHKCDANTTK